MDVFNVFLVFGTIFVPIWGYMFWRFDRLQGAPAFILTELSLGILTTWTCLVPVEIPKVTSWLSIYALFLMVYSITLSGLWGVQSFNKIMAVSLWTVFIAADWWEIPVFIYGGLGLFNGLYSAWSGTWVDQIHRLYVVVTIILFLQVARPQLPRRILVAAIATGSLWSFLALLPFFGPPWGPILARTGPLLILDLILGKTYFAGLNIAQKSARRWAFWLDE